MYSERPNRELKIICNISRFDVWLPHKLKDKMFIKYSDRPSSNLSQSKRTYLFGLSIPDKNRGCRLLF